MYNGEQKQTNNTINSGTANSMSTTKPVRMDKINMDFDHLSVVSEECLSNGDDPANGSSNGVDEAMLAGYQSTVPPLTHFENLCYKDIGQNIGTYSKMY